MLSIKNKFQLFIPANKNEVSLQNINTITYTIKRKTSALIDNLTSYASNSQIKFIASDTELKYIKGRVYDSQNRLVGGWFQLNPVIKDFLEMYNFESQAIFLFNKDLLSDKAVKYLNSVYANYNSCPLSNVLFKMLTDTDLKPLKDNLPPEIIEQLVNNWAAGLNLIPGSWEYSPENGIKFNKTPEEVLNEVREGTIQESVVQEETETLQSITIRVDQFLEEEEDEPEYVDHPDNPVF
jgi:hypothetical protein